MKVQDLETFSISIPEFIKKKETIKNINFSPPELDLFKIE